MRFLFVCVLLLLSVNAAEARRYRHHHIEQQTTFNLFQTHERSSNRTQTQIVSGRPSGCPHAYCGCSASLYKFGRIIPELNLAANWYRFPRTSPHPGAAGVRAHHVFILESHVQGDVWIVHDGNSGNGLTRIHERSIAGYTIVDPDASHMAGL